METALERSQRPSTRPTTARESRARTGEPLWPSVTGWLRRKTWPRGGFFKLGWTRRRGLRRKSGLPWELRKYEHSGPLEDEAKGQ